MRYTGSIALAVSPRVDEVPSEKTILQLEVK